VLVEAAAIERLPNGLCWRFASSPTLLTRLAPLIDAERQCCRFLTVTLQAQLNLGDVVLDVTGPAGTREFLETWLYSVLRNDVARSL